ncbi:MAG: DUF4290 domain-containing protein [Bacteroidaceae bacterium]|jgi:hypothetical protein|nr:DUF4290 domain-containing protein [Bacteroidaceae bacterium]MBO5951923.1 DUF4290 domain-containing protein [Bacteroidaceae bacterium]MBR4302373.1 DUF4290 domain-containing protein [Bacteroidaceae bacterium]
MNYNYNTQRDKLPMPEYGRSIQKMVDYALTIEDKAERQKCADSIIAIMGNMYPALRDVPDFRNKLWDHLAFMSDYKLEIDYPCEITILKKGRQEPDRIEYSNGDIRFVHYGRIVPELIEKVSQMEEGPARNQLVRLVAVQMKKNLMTWNKEMVDDERIANDMYNLSRGRIQLREGDLNVTFAQAPPQQNQQKNGKKKIKKRY